MEVTAVVLFGGALAHYDVDVHQDGTCTAHLTKYNGTSINKPDETIHLHKEGRHWVANNSDKALSDDLGYAIELKAKPLLTRNRGGGHPAG